MKTYKILITTVIAVLAMLMFSTQAMGAGYQSVQTTSPTSAATTDWLNAVRNLESEGQVMGLREEVGANLESNSGSNNIDVHMMKNTEYGAMVLLSSSYEYGKQVAEGDTSATQTSRYVLGGTGMTTTTGNVYGVYFNNPTTKKGENVAGGTVDRSDISSKYYNHYPTESTTYNGDAMYQLWHGASYSIEYYQSSYRNWGSSSPTLKYPNAAHYLTRIQQRVHESYYYFNDYRRFDTTIFITI